MVKPECAMGSERLHRMRPDFGVTLRGDGGVEIRGGECWTVASESRRAYLVGRVEYLVDYEALALRTADGTAIREVLVQLIRANDIIDASDVLTELSGDFVVIVVEPMASWVYKSEDIGIPLYVSWSGDDLVIGQSWRNMVRGDDAFALDPHAVASFMRTGQVKPPATLYSDLTQLLPYTLYRRDGQRLVEQAHTFPGLHFVRKHGTPSLNLDHLCKALACYAEHVPEVALAFSGGSDSTLLLRTYREKVGELLTLHYKPPFQQQARETERMQSLEAGRLFGKTCRIVEVDWDDVPRLEPYQRAFAAASPFSSFPAAAYYDAVSQAAAPFVMTGQNADNVWDWGFHQMAWGRSKRSTSARDFQVEWTFWRDKVLKLGVPVRSRIAAITRRYLERALVALSYRRLLGAFVLQRWHPLDGPWKRLVEFPYKLFTARRFLTYFICGESTVWQSAAHHAGKRMLYPYTSPLMLHVTSHLRRTNYLDLKSPMRRISPAIVVPEARECSRDFVPLAESPVFDVNESQAMRLSALEIERQEGARPNVERVAAKHLSLMLERGAVPGTPHSVIARLGDGPR